MVLTFVACVTFVTNALFLDHTTAVMTGSGIARCTNLIFATALLITILAVRPMFMFWAKVLKLK